MSATKAEQPKEMTTAQDPQSALQQPQPRTPAEDRRNILFCVVLFLLAVAATNPVLEMGVNDDWSYTHMAREFALSGHFTYNGWPAAMLLPQLVWSAAFIKLFGFSFLVVRLSTVVLAAFLIPVLYHTGRESGLAPPFALFLTLLSALSPLVLPETVSFMSDVPGFFLFALCFYGGVKSWKAANTKACIAWAGLIAIAGVLSGLDRQIYWLGPLLFLPVVAWIQRRKKGAVMGLGVAWLSTILAVLYFVMWFQAKPYTLTEHTLDYWERGKLSDLAAHALHVTAGLGLTAGLILLPLLVGYTVPGFQSISRKLALLVLAAVLGVEFAVSIRLHHRMPGVGNILTEYGILSPGAVALGMRPVILGPVVSDLLTLAVLLSCAGCVLTLWKRRGNEGSHLWNDPAAPALVLGFVFAAAWLPAVLFRAANGVAFDRYLIPFLPLAAVPLLRHYQVHIRPRVSRLSWAMLTLFALYGVATTHDAFAASRARSIAARTLEQAGIPRTEITAGFEYDGWTQVEAVGYLNHPQIENPIGAFRPVACSGPRAVQLWYLMMMPAIHARYFVVLARAPELEDGPVGPVDYTTWLPPARRQVFTQKLPGGGYADCR